MASEASPAVKMTNIRYKWWVVFMLWFICFFNYADRQAIFSVFPKLKEEFGFDKVQLGQIGSAFMLVYAFGAPFAGFIGDRVKRKNLILGGCLFWSGITMMTGWCGKLWHFVTVRALEGFGETFYFPASMSLVSDYHGPATRSRALSFHQSSVYVGTIAGSWAGAWFAEKHGWRTGFYFFGGAGILLALVLYRFLREPRRGQSEESGQEPRGSGAGILPASGVASTTARDNHAPDSPEGRLEARPIGPEGRLEACSTSAGRPPLGEAVREAGRAIFQKPTALVLMAVFLGANFVAMIFLTWTPTFLVEKFHFKLTAAGLSGTVFIHLASAVSAPLAGVLADRLSRRLPGGRMLVQAFGLLVGSVFVFLVGTTREVSTLLVAMALFGFCKGFYDSNIFASLYDVVEPRVRATAAGLMNTVGWGGGALAPLAVGWVAKHGRHASEVENMSEAIAFGGIIYLAGAALLFTAIFVLGKRDFPRNAASGL